MRVARRIKKIERTGRREEIREKIPEPKRRERSWEDAASEATS